MLQRAVAAYIIVAVGRVTELIPGLIGLPVAKIFMAVICLLALLQPAGLRGNGSFRDLVPRRASWFLGLSVLSVLFSVYKSYSLEYVLTGIPPIALAFFFVWKSVSSTRQLRYFLVAFELSALMLVAVAVTNYAGGRIGVSSSNEMSYDTNDLAYILVTTLAISLALASASRGAWSRVFHLGCAVAFMLTILRTESRGGLLAMLVIVVQVIALLARRRAARSRDAALSGAWIVASIAATVAVAVIVWSVIPADARARLSTVTSLGTDYNADLSNTTGRLSIWGRAVGALISRPIGYGVASFPTVDALTGGKYKAAHNSVLEIAVELGVLGLILYVLLLKAAFAGLASRSKPPARAPPAEEAELTAAASGLRFALAANTVASLFLSQAYSNAFWILLAIIAATQRLLHKSESSPVPAAVVSVRAAS